MLIISFFTRTYIKLGASWIHWFPCHWRWCVQLEVVSVNWNCSAGLLCFERLFAGFHWCQPKWFFFCKLQTGLLNWECPCIDVGESSINGCTVCKKQEKADGCSVNGASSLDLIGRETFSLSEFLKAHWFFILAGFICFWITAVLLSLDIEPFTGLHIPLFFWYLLF